MIGSSTRPRSGAHRLRTPARRMTPPWAWWLPASRNQCPAPQRAASSAATAAGCATSFLYGRPKCRPPQPGPGPRPCPAPRMRQARQGRPGPPSCASRSCSPARCRRKTASASRQPACRERKRDVPPQRPGGHATAIACRVAPAMAGRFACPAIAGATSQPFTPGASRASPAAARVCPGPHRSARLSTSIRRRSAPQPRTGRRAPSPDVHAHICAHYPPSPIISPTSRQLRSERHRWTERS